MDAPGPRHAAPSPADGDGVRVVRESRPWPHAALVLALAGAALALGWVLSFPPTAPDAPAHQGDAAVTEAPVAAAQPAPTRTPRAVATRPPATRPASEPFEARQGPDDLPSTDPDDLAAWIDPSDPEPSAAEVILALQASGDHTGLGAFNPPGTSPPLPGLAVPEDFVLPEGYVRHHQVTDEGEALEPILMFSPDYVLRDAAGRELPLPEDRVVPPELAPPGLPLRPITIPRP